MADELAAWHNEPSKLTIEIIQRYALGQHRWTECYIWCENGQPVGFLNGYNAFDTPKAIPFFEISAWFVAGQCRRQGIGRQMLNAIAALKFGQGAQLLKWGVRKSNIDAIRFYAAVEAELHDRGDNCRVYFYPAALVRMRLAAKTN